MPLINGSSSRRATALPLSALLSQVLVAFTIECDNEFERQMRHWTTNHGSTGGSRQGPWLVSIMMWWNCMRFVGPTGVRVGQLETLAGLKTNLKGMLRWGYVVVRPDPSGCQKPRPSDMVIHATSKGREAQQIWQALPGTIEKRWQARFGQAEVDQLRKSLVEVIAHSPVELPDCLPILGYGLNNRVIAPLRPAAGHEALLDLPLPVLVSRLLLGFAIQFERESDLSLAISANVLRVLDQAGVRVRDLPNLTGVSKEAISMALGFLAKRRVVTVSADPSHTKFACLTGKGREAQHAFPESLRIIEKRWQVRLGNETFHNLRKALEKLVGEPNGVSPLFRGLDPYPDGWRASVPKPEILPHYPMVLHR